MGGELGSENYIDVLLVFIVVSTKFHLDREWRFLCKFCVQKLVLLNFRRYLGEIESGAGNNLVFFMYFVFCVCSAVSGSALPMFKSQLSNKSGGAKAFGNMSVFDWPRSNWWLMCDLVWVWSLWHRFKKWNACCACCRVVSFQTARSYRELTTEVKRLLNIITRFRTARAIGTATANRQIYACAFGLCRF